MAHVGHAVPPEGYAPLVQCTMISGVASPFDPAAVEAEALESATASDPPNDAEEGGGTDDEDQGVPSLSDEEQDEDDEDSVSAPGDNVCVCVHGLVAVSGVEQSDASHLSLAGFHILVSWLRCA